MTAGRDDNPVHATCVMLEGRGVLLFGKSGSGKSDLALRLIDRGWALVADDYTALSIGEGRLIASPPASIAGEMEVRGVGLVVMPYARDCPLSLAIDLDKLPDRLPEPGEWAALGCTLPLFALNAFEASAPLKVEHLLRLFGLAVK